MIREEEKKGKVPRSFLGWTNTNREHSKACHKNKPMQQLARVRDATRNLATWFDTSFCRLPTALVHTVQCGGTGVHPAIIVYLPPGTTGK